MHIRDAIVGICVLHCVVHHAVAVSAIVVVDLDGALSMEIFR